MKLIFSLLTLGLLGCLLSHETTAYCPSAPKCDGDLYEKIKGIWCITGTPQNVTEELKKGYVVYASTTDGTNDGIKGILVNATTYSCNHTTYLTVTYIKSCGSNPVTSVVSEENGVFSFPDGLKWDIIYFGNGVIFTYACYPSKGKAGLPLGNILVKKDSLKKNCTLEAIKGAKGLAYTLGFKFTKEYKYPDVCY